MPVYTVHEPPLRPGQPTADPERFAFVRDGFYFWAFLLTPLWMLWRQLWLVLVLYLAVGAAIGAALRYVGAPFELQFGIAALIALLIGFEAGTLRRWTLAHRGWSTVGLVVGDDLEAAEHRFFASWIARQSSRSPKEPAAPAVPTVSAITAAQPPRVPRPASDIVGLFPEPGARR
jgi:Protein of unknown function (DUF2628)